MVSNAIKARNQVLAVGSSSRITAQGGAESIQVGIGPLLCPWRAIIILYHNGHERMVHRLDEAGGARDMRRGRFVVEIN
jgi:hypothetical protein